MPAASLVGARRRFGDNLPPRDATETGIPAEKPAKKPAEKTDAAQAGRVPFLRGVVIAAFVG